MCNYLVNVIYFYGSDVGPGLCGLRNTNPKRVVVKRFERPTKTVHLFRLRVPKRLFLILTVVPR